MGKINFISDLSIKMFRKTSSAENSLIFNILQEGMFFLRK